MCKTALVDPPKTVINFTALIIDSFFTGSHKYWGEELQKRLPFKVELLTLSGKHWKWRMEGGAYELAQKFKKTSGLN